MHGLVCRAIEAAGREDLGIGINWKSLKVTTAGPAVTIQLNETEKGNIR